MTGIQKKQRLLTMIFGAFAIFFTGYSHVWSIYQPYVMEQAGWSQGQASMCFYLALSTFVFGNILGGRMQARMNPQRLLKDSRFFIKIKFPLSVDRFSIT